MGVFLRIGLFLIVGMQVGVVSGQNTWFQDGQSADLMLSGFGFNKSGGKGIFNHPTGVTTSGNKLFVCDRWNNRILIWNSLPSSNTDPDVVIGQSTFTTNNPGTSKSEMNWPGAVSVAGGKMVVADSYNDRLLIWNSIPTSNGTAANISIDVAAVTSHMPGALIDGGFPWGIWTDGTKMAATVTFGGFVLLWNTMPTTDDQAPDVILTGVSGSGQGVMGTPRTITSNGQYILVGDHNQTYVSGTGQGSFVWEHWPTKDTAFEYMLQDYNDANFAWLQGDISNDSMALFGRYLYLYTSMPSDSTDATTPDLTVTACDYTGGDGSDVSLARGKIFVSAMNSNTVYVYNSWPTTANQEPDFALLSPHIDSNTLHMNYFITNPIPATDGHSLLVSSDFDRTLSVWDEYPDTSNTAPDRVIDLNEAYWDNSFHRDTFIMAGNNGVEVYTTPPIGGTGTSTAFTGSIGSVTFQEIKGVAHDQRFFYLSDKRAEKVYVWDKVPSTGSENPLFSFSYSASPTRLYSDGNTLAVLFVEEHEILLYNVSTLTSSSTAFDTIENGVGENFINLPEHVIVDGETLIISSTGSQVVVAWNDASEWGNKDDATIIGESSFSDRTPEIGEDKTFWPAGLAYRDNKIWVGEYKFQGRLVHYTFNHEPGDHTGPAGIRDATTNVLWLDADSGGYKSSGVLAANGETTEFWYDRSGNNQFYEQSSTSDRPTLTTGTSNGHAVLRFDGSSDGLDGQIGDAFDGPATVFAVAYYDQLNQPSSDVDLLFTIGAVGTNSNLAIGRTDAGYTDGGDLYFSYDGSALKTGGTITGQQFGMVSQTFSKSDTKHAAWLDGSSSTVQDYSGNVFTSGLSAIGYEPASSANYFDGDLAELIVYNRELNNAERIVIENYLGGKHDLTVSNDFYAGDDASKGDYDFTIQGIGTTDGTDENTHAISKNGGGLHLQESSSSLNASGEYLFSGHQTGSNAETTSDVTGSIVGRWSRIWYLDKTGSVDALLTFSLADAGMAGSAGTASGYKLLYRSGTSGNFSDVGLSDPSVSGDEIAFTITNTDLADGYYTLGSTNASSSPLPLELMHFTGKREKNRVKLHWQTALEQDIVSFQLEKSKNGANFIPIANLEAQHPFGGYYEHFDPKPGRGPVYYRLTYRELDDRVYEAKTISVDGLLERPKLQVYPNPSTHGRFQIKGLDGQFNQVEVVNELGRVVLSENAEGLDVLHLDSGLPQGMYWVRFVGDGLVETKVVLIR